MNTSVLHEPGSGLSAPFASEATFPAPTTSVNAVAIRELTENSRHPRADRELPPRRQPSLLGILPDLGVDPATITADLETERTCS